VRRADREIASFEARRGHIWDEAAKMHGLRGRAARTGFEIEDPSAQRFKHDTPGLYRWSSPTNSRSLQGRVRSDTPGRLSKR